MSALLASGRSDHREIEYNIQSLESIGVPGCAELRTTVRVADNNVGASLVRASLCGLSLCLSSFANGSTNIDICKNPATETHVAIAYYDHENTSFEGNPGATNRVDFSSDFLFKLSEKWIVGIGHRSTTLNVDDLVLQTNGHLHTGFLPVHRISHSGVKSFRLSIAPVISGSSNVTNRPDEYTRDALQLLAAMVWSRPVSEQLGLSYGICGDHRLGGYQVYPVVSFEWQPRTDWKIELGFPTSRISYDITKMFNVLLRISPNGNEWYVRNKSLEKDSRLIYESYVIDMELNWRLHQHLSLTASVGREFNGRYEMTLFDDSRVRLSSNTATRIGAALAWFF